MTHVSLLIRRSSDLLTLFFRLIILKRAISIHLFSSLYIMLSATTNQILSMIKYIIKNNQQKWGKVKNICSVHYIPPSFSDLNIIQICC